jgi:hypothetical protein
VRRLPAVIDGLAGGLWWNFHDGSASMIHQGHRLGLT